MKNEIDNILKYEKYIDNDAILHWGHFRIKFQYEYLKQLNVINSIQFDMSSLSIRDKIKYSISCLTKLNLAKLLFNRKKVLIFSHPRAPKGSDIHTRKLQSDFKGSSLVVTHSEKFEFQGNSVDCYTDLFRIFSKVISKLIYIIFSYRGKCISPIVDNLIVDPKIKKLIYKMYVKNSVEFDILYAIYFFWLSISKFESLYIVTGYYNLPLIAAARKKGITTTEIQHGVISKYHIGYNTFMEHGELIFSDRIFFWGEYWAKACNLPIKTKGIIYGTDHYDNYQSDVNKIKNTVVIISQTSISERIEKFLTNNLNFLSKYRLYIKLHPGEFSKKSYLLNKFSKYENVSIISNEKTLEELLAFCEYQIGGYSTGIYQGIISGCKTVLINSPGIYYMETLIPNNSIMLADHVINEDDFYSLTPPCFESKYFFSPINSEES